MATTNPNAIARLTTMRATKENAVQRASLVRALGLGMVGGQSQSSYGSWSAGDPVALARPPEDFTQGSYGPSTPMRPSNVDVPPDGLERPQPRRWEYPASWNMMQSPGNEGTRLAPFKALRQYADMSTFVRACLDKRIEEILGLEWDIVPTIEAEKSMVDLAAHKDFQERRIKAMQFFSRPDPEYDTFHSWLKAALEDVFVIDALSIYIAPPRVPGHGLFGTDLAALALIAGETIRPMVDLQGGRPQPPAVAFQQYIWGVPRVDLLDVIAQDELDEDLGVPDKELRGDQMLYLPYNRKTVSPYGRSHVESCLVPISIEMSKQKYALSYYAEGNVPASWVTIGNADTPQQVRQWQDSLDATIGDIGARHQVTVLPSNSHAIETKPNAFTDNYDMANKEEILAVFGLTAMEMGMMPGRSGSSGGMAGSAHMAQIGSNASARTATKPLLMFLKRNLFDLVLQKFAGQKDMQWKWLGIEPEIDVDKKLTADIALVAAGVRSRDEVRTERGWQAWGLPLTAEPTVDTKMGVESLADPTHLTGMIAATATDQSGLDTTGDDVVTTGTTVPNNPASSGRTDTGPSPTVATPLHAATPSGPPASGSDQPTTKAAVNELNKLRAYLRHGKDIAKFKTDVLPKSALQIVADNVRTRGVAKTIRMVQGEVEREGDPDYAEVAQGTARLLRSARYGNISENAMRSGVVVLMADSINAEEAEALVGTISAKSNSGECLDMLERFDALRRRTPRG